MSDVSTIPIETLAEDMFQLVTECAGKKNLKAGDLAKAMIAKRKRRGRRRGGGCSKDDCKKAIRIPHRLGPLRVRHFGGSFIQLPPKPGAGQ